MTWLVSVVLVSILRHVGMKKGATRIGLVKPEGPRQQGDRCSLK